MYCSGTHDTRFYVTSFAFEQPVKLIRILFEPRDSFFRATKITPSEDVDLGTLMTTSVVSLVGTEKEEVVELKKFILLTSVVAIVVAALALPAMADERWDNSNWWDNRDHNAWWDNNDWWKDHEDFDHAAAPVVNQESAQEAESGDVDQSFTVTGSSDNSNQCVGIQGVANTGNAQNQISVLQNGSEADDFSFEDSGASINVSPSHYTSCDQQVNQAASASYGW